jgi:hypothetical protein
MKKLILFFVLQLIIFIVSETLAQTNTREGPAVVRFLPQGYGIKLLNSSGTSSVINDISNLGFMNPASISDFENYSTGISYQFNTSIDEAWIADFGTSRVYNFYPQSVGGIVKWNDFTIGFGFGQKYNGTLDMDPIPVTTVQQPDGTGEFFQVKQETMIHSYSLTAAYSFKELLQTTNDITLGFRYSFNHLLRNEEIWHSSGSATDYGSNIAVGLSYKINLNDQQQLILGTDLETKSDFKAKYEIDNNILIIYDPEDTNHIQIPAETDNFYLTHTLPFELRFDLALDATTDLKLLANISRVFWKTKSTILEDQVEFSFSTFYDINEMFTTSIGFYSTNCEFNDIFYSQLNDGLNTLFLTAGLKLIINQFSIDLALADSHLFSGDYTKQTIGKLSLGINL